MSRNSRKHSASAKLAEMASRKTSPMRNDIAYVPTYSASGRGYRSVETMRHDGQIPIGASGDYHALYDREWMINQSRAFLRDNGIYKGLIERAISYIIGTGFTLQIKTDDTALNSKIEGLWADCWRRPEVRGILSGRMLEEMVGREMLVAGDTLLLKTDTGLLQHFEAEQIRDVKGKTDGIKKDQYGKPLSFSVCPWEEFGSLSTKPTTVDAKNAFFITKPERPSSVRGVPPCQSSFPMLHRVNDVCDSEAIAYQLISRIAISINREDGGVLALQESKPESTDFRKRIYELGYALVFNAEPGEKIQGVERNIPGKNFTESIVMFLRLLGLPLGMPLELVLLDWTKSNYSQSRAVLLQAYKTFVLWQQLIEDFFHDPVLDWKIREWCKAGLLPRKLAQTAIKRQWLVPTYPWLDLVKEAEAYGLKVERCFSTHAEVCKSLDSDLEDVLRARRSEVERAIKIKQEIKKETGENVPYEIFCGLKVQPTAAGKQTKGGKDEGNEEEEEVNDG